VIEELLVGRVHQHQLTLAELRINATFSHFRTTDT